MSPATMTETRPLTPEARRRDDAPEGEFRPITLGDGQVWPLPSPSLAFCAAIRPDGSVGFQVEPEGMPPGYGELFDLAMETTSDAESLNAIFGMTAILLRSAYDVADGEIPKLIRVATGQAGAAGFQPLYDHCLGRAPAKN